MPPPPPPPTAVDERGRILGGDDNHYHTDDDTNTMFPKLPADDMPSHRRSTSLSSNSTAASDRAPPPWTARQQAPPLSGSRRLSNRTPYSLRQQQDAAAEAAEQSLLAQAIRTGKSLLIKAWVFFLSLSPIQQGLVVVGCIVLGVLGLVMLIYSHRIFAILGPIAQRWRELPGGWAIVWALCFISAFPPLIGYSSTVTIAGFVYGFPMGWPIVATATVAGSTAAFYTSRGVFSGYVHRLVGSDRRFVALGQVLRRDGVGVLAMIRLCPLPYSLSNGFLATVGSIKPLTFASATALATPKLLVHVFIGSRLALLVESGDKMSTGDRVINYASMAFGGLIGFGVGLVIYRRTMKRAAEIAREVGDEEGLDGLDEEMVADPRDSRGDYGDYDDDDTAENSRLMRARGGPGAVVPIAEQDAAALMMDDDDISLWGTDTGYHDSWEDGNDKHGLVVNGVKR
ncbi:hypothetical protein B0H63DRAFT_55519 [Podospora didyma]|uniref:Golgi apparatus membrane protein TVP38 n=1 Tax=Podospora didyma TaxID=330526 RepID=A0AAE0U8S9_9PEZI|nr:hypothetical protein B0H63DRAFT_55519 [Podospora didyma]